MIVAHVQCKVKREHFLYILLKVSTGVEIQVSILMYTGDAHVATKYDLLWGLYRV